MAFIKMRSTSFILLLFFWTVVSRSVIANETVSDFKMAYNYAEYFKDRPGVHQWCFQPHRRDILNATAKLSCTNTNLVVDIVNISHSISLHYSDWCNHGLVKTWKGECGKSPVPSDCKSQIDTKDCRTACEKPEKLCEYIMDNADTYREGCKGMNECTMELQPINLIENCKDIVQGYINTSVRELFWSKWVTIHYRCVSAKGIVLLFLQSTFTRSLSRLVLGW